jgi:hypothetical protein
VADQDINEVMVRRFPCLCKGCAGRFDKPIKERYANPCDDCEYFGIFQGLNNWKKITFVERKDCDPEDLTQTMELTLWNLGK